MQIEATRASARYGPLVAAATRERLRYVALKPIDDRIVETAGRLDPPALRSLDAIHLATALSLGDDLGVFVAYDQRLLEAARAAGLEAVAPV